MAKDKIVKKPSIAKMNNRIFAYIIDWYAGWVFCAIPVGFMWNLLTRETTINTDLTRFTFPYNFLAGLIGIIFGIVYFYVVPLKLNGQTLGKRLMKIRISDENGNALSPKNLAIRQICGVMFLESPFMLTGSYFTQLVGIVTAPIVTTVLNYILLVGFIVSAFFVFKEGRALHDKVAHSIVTDI